MKNTQIILIVSMTNDKIELLIIILILVVAHVVF